MRVAILAHDKFGPLTSKTGVCILRYSKDYETVAVIDRSKAGKTADAFVGKVGRNVPVVAHLRDALKFNPECLIIGIAPMGGALPEAWRPELRLAIENKMQIVSGLHSFIGDDAELSQLAMKHGTKIWDVRRPTRPNRIATGEGASVKGLVVHTMGTDCNSGKMTAAVELAREAQRRGIKAAFAATGQTGIMIGCDAGAPIDRIISDFVAGAAEELVLECDRQGADLTVVEGQGSLDHFAYSGVTLGLLHGCYPDLVVLCHQAGRQQLGEYSRHEEEMVQKIRPLSWHVETIERLTRPVHATKVCAVALATFAIPDDAEAKKALQAAAKEAGVPAFDPVRFGPGPLLDAVVEASKGVKKSGVNRLRTSPATVPR
ncbi:MAG: DUF1611 domain-containing protein [Euryarchaeota archaeon]|nr:DUF1611 domain-containing protein [Euryarchaeota archaeon]